MSEEINPNTKSLEEIENDLQNNGRAKNAELMDKKINTGSNSKGGNSKYEENCLHTHQDEEELTELIHENLEIIKNEEVSKLNPETEIFTQSDPDELKIRKTLENKLWHNKKNKNQPL